MKIFITQIIFLLLSCAENISMQENLTGRQWEGWAGPPHNPNLKPHDYFYTTLIGEVKSQKVNPEDMKKTCVDSVRAANPEKTIQKVIREMIDSTNDGPSFSDSEIRTFAKDKIPKEKRLEIKTCNQISSSNDWKNCECIVYIHISGGRDYIFY